MKIYVTSIFVDDQQKALDFYTQKLGFVVKNDIPMGEFRWLTVVSPENESGTELLLEPDKHPAVGPYKSALKADGIPAASFEVSDMDAEFKRLTDIGVEFHQEPTPAGPVIIAALDDTCGNLVQLIQHA